MGARQMGLAYASATISDEWSLWNNIAGIARQQKNICGAAYEVTPTLIGANRMALTAVVPFRWAVMGAGVFRFGDQVYSEQLATIGIAHQIGITSLGAKVNWVQYRADGFGLLSTASIDFGGISNLTKQMSIGAYITNLTQSSFSAADDYRLPTRLVVGINFHLNNSVLVATEVEKDLNYKPIFKAGLEYEPVKNFFVRGGFNFYPQNFYIGLGSKWKTVTTNYAVRFNNLLGSTHQISASICWGKVLTK